MAEPLKWAPELIALFDGAKQRLVKNGDVGGAIFNSVIDFNNKKQDLLVDYLPIIDGMKSKLYGSHRDRFSPLYDYHLETIGSFVGNLQDNFYFRKPFVEKVLRGEHIIEISYQLGPDWNALFWNPDSLDVRPQR